MDEQLPPYPAINFNSPEWGEMKRWMLGRRQELLAKAIHLNTPWEEVLIARGRASQIDEMLAFEELAAPNPLGLPR